MTVSTADTQAALKVRLMGIWVKTNYVALKFAKNELDDSTLSPLLPTLKK